MKKLQHKHCNICGTVVYGKKRADRSSYHYPPRCPDCTRKVFDPIKLENKRLAALKVHDENRLPIGSTRLNHSSKKLTYRLVKVAQPDVWEYEHRVVLGAPAGAQVHHINGNTLDNSIENLILLDPKSHRNEHGLNGKWSLKYDSCIVCNSTSRKHLSHGQCTACYQRLRYTSTENN